MTEAESFRARTEFVVELSRRLHAYGTTSQRLEAAVGKVAKRLGLTCEIWANPTGIIISFGGGIGPNGGPENTRVLRMPPGDVNLARLCRADAIAEQVLAGELNVAEGSAALRALETEVSSAWARLLTVLCFGLTSASVAVLFGSGWAELVAAGLIGLVIGVLCEAAVSRPRLNESVDALAAFVATFIAFAISEFITPLALDSVVIAAIIVLLPGLTLTNAVSELSTQQLVAGTTRFAGAVAILLKLTFGAVAAMQIGRALGWVMLTSASQPMGDLALWVALAVAACAFAVLFRAELRDYPLVIAAAIGSFLATRMAGAAFGSEAGIFFAGLLISAAANLYARLANRPGAVIRVPGIILLVPGSTGFRSVSFVFERDVFNGLEAAVTVITVLISLVAGLMFGNLLVPPRRNL
ncbi:threonine/serine ThrE exporter family protein [Pseudomarimonas salicorniae]|uniref:Threonine/serine exporter family protein n=1 Tax=Pseudomarimonas salicorniae TaxID=2933270 RepID=A0ABT0GHK0_9GAMM|nr:threonine/serine exporter family protein [Lysobacter sp. CAU 1642]MCK7594019.1 threonine/serine exporter family protein [Lysobacter sp. CAU 1642]